MKRIIHIAFVFLVLIAASCKKEAGIGGRKTITGTVHYKNGATGTMEIANGATVMICYGTKTFSSAYDQTVLADANGEYHIDGLQKGDYFVTAEFTDMHGFKYTTTGYGITIETRKGNLTLDVDLQ